MQGLNITIDGELFPKLAKLTEQELVNRLMAVRKSPLAMLECKSNVVKMMANKQGISEEVVRKALDSKVPNAIKMYAQMMEISLLTVMELSV